MKGECDLSGNLAAFFWPISDNGILFQDRGYPSRGRNCRFAFSSTCKLTVPGSVPNCFENTCAWWVIRSSVVPIFLTLGFDSLSGGAV